jgi:CRISPR-associated protein (TIGR03986 family)
MLPKMIDNIDTNRIAFAPYNFVPLPEKVVQAEAALPHDTYHTERHTGTITCTLTTASPLYVRCGLTAEQLEQGLEAKELADFFYLLDRSHPVIPGSSLRGMLRALVEIASYGKMDKVTDMPRYFYRAVAAKMDDPLAMPYRNQLRNVRAGYLEQRGREWFIHPARLIGNEGYLKAREQDIPPALGLVRLNDPQYHLQTIPVSFTTKKLKPSPRSPQGRLVIDLIGAPGKYADEGWIVTSGSMLETGGNWQRSPRKNHAVIGAAGTGELKIAETAVDDYRNGLSNYVIEQLGPDGVLQDRRPVFYCEPPRNSNGEVVYFGHNPNFRLPFRFPGSQRAATPLDFVPSALRNDAQIDIAEAIFGFVRRSKREQEQALAGRVFVDDATLAPDQHNIWYSDEPITPRILATPKPTTFQHYLVQPSAVRPELKHYANKPGEETMVRGHKLYWHKGDQPNIGLPTEQQDIKDTQKTQIRPVRTGVTFTFDVRFENLSDIELGALLWVLQLAADDEYRLKLGMGKPLGMGAVKIDSEIMLNDRRNRYAALFDGNGWATGAEQSLPITEFEQQKHCIAAFQKHVLEQSSDISGNGNLRDNLRIRCLLALLRWPGLLPEMTRYMEIERDVRQGVIPAAEIKRNEQKVNEYKLRPVLPSPTQVVGEVIIAVTQPAIAQPIIAEQQAAPPRLTALTLPASGDTFTGKVVGVDETAVLIAVPGFGEDKAIGVLKAEAIVGGRTDRYRVGNAARVEVTGTRTLQSGRMIVELRPGAKRQDSSRS